MLGWSILDLAKAAGLSVSTIRRAEGSMAQPVSGFVIAVMRDALEKGGVVFLDDDDGEGPGVRLRAMRR
jgi:AcrR family transcriptional regulator